MNKQAPETTLVDEGFAPFSKTHQAYLLTVWHPKVTRDGALFVMVQTAESNECKKFVDLSSAFAFLEKVSQKTQSKTLAEET